MICRADGVPFSISIALRGLIQIKLRERLCAIFHLSIGRA